MAFHQIKTDLDQAMKRECVFKLPSAGKLCITYAVY